MERLITSPAARLQDTGYLAQLLLVISEAPVLMFANTKENSPGDQYVVSVRRFTDPRLRTERWALVLEGEFYTVRDYVNREEARLAYLDLLTRYARGGVVWDATSDGWRA